MDPLVGVHAGIDLAAAPEHVERTVHALDVRGKDDALAAVALGCVVDDIRVFNDPGIDAHFIRAALQHAVEILQRRDAAAHSKRDKNLFRCFHEDVREDLAVFYGCRDVVEYQLVRAVFAVELREIHRGRHVVQPLEVHAFYDPAVLHVHAGNDPFCYHFATSIASRRSTAPV